MLSHQPNYYATVARSLGVPDMWVEDAAQDIWLRCWQQDDDSGFKVRAAAIDAARRYGPYSRRGIARIAPTISEPCDPYVVVDHVLDFRAAWLQLSQGQRMVLRERLQRDRWPNAHQVRVSAARRVLRALVA